MAVIRLSNTSRNARLTALVNAIGANGLVRFYTGTMPASPDTAVSGGNTLLGTLTGAATFGTVSNGVMTANPIANDESADADGVVAWARISTSAGVGVIDVDVSNTAGTGIIKMNTTNIYAGGPLQISSFSLTEPA